MNKKELKERIENASKNKYIYQRYNGLITKYIDDGDYYIDCNTGIAIKKNEHLMLGKVSENIIDLIEIGDIVNKLEIFRVAEYNENYDAKVVYHETDEEAIPISTDEIETILTHEQYEANCYKVGGEDEF